MAVNTIDAKIKRLNNMGGYIAPRTAEILKHLVEQSQMQAAENVLVAMDYTKLEAEMNRQNERLKKDLKTLQNDNRIYFLVIISMWLAAISALGVTVYYG